MSEHTTGPSLAERADTAYRETRENIVSRVDDRSPLEQAMHRLDDCIEHLDRALLEHHERLAPVLDHGRPNADEGSLEAARAERGGGRTQQIDSACDRLDMLAERLRALTRLVDV